jgi:hypothetical protein
MKLYVFLLSFYLIIFTSLNAQKTRVFDPNNARDGESVE